mmetsp:Transcript_78112/g.142054  ORF Transcript_78112/g.142054 Transcript_78112/m.142054 type:complete len:196 (-) Transcript_78112:79-666(-)
MQKLALFVCALVTPAQSDPNVLPGKCDAVVADYWGPYGACIQAAGVGYKQYHCPWESMLLCSNVGYKGCANCLYDCANTDYNALLAMYASTPVPEGTPAQKDYVMCCLKEQCVNGKTAMAAKDACGAIPAGRLYDAYLPNMMKSASGMTTLAACVFAFVLVTTGVACAAVRIRRSSFREIAATSEDEEQVEESLE